MIKDGAVTANFLSVDAFLPAKLNRNFMAV